ncbi:MAG TPA: hypothetical protein ENJ00_03660 [Phycisphaerales bacterium]|nr:hypothetical protein [Phycisphaerales bacterium]
MGLRVKSIGHCVGFGLAGMISVTAHGQYPIDVEQIDPLTHSRIFPINKAPFPVVDYNHDGASDAVDILAMMGGGIQIPVCNSPDSFLYDFNLNGLCEYDIVDSDDANLIANNPSITYKFYWCVTDQDDGGTTGHFGYQMDNQYARNSMYGQTNTPTEVVGNVAIFYQSRSGFWPVFSIGPQIYVGGLHALLEPTPGPQWDVNIGNNHQTWQYRIRNRFRKQGFDPDVDGIVSGNWLDCWNGYMALHHRRLAGDPNGQNPNEPGAVRELTGVTSFNGFGVLDFEQMLFDWDYQNAIGCGNCVGLDEWRTKVAEINSPLVDPSFLSFMDGTEWAFTPEWSSGLAGPWNQLENKEELYEKSWNYFMYLLVKESLDACREVSGPDAKWGFYSYPRRTNNLTNVVSPLTTKTNDALSWMWDDEADDAVYVDMLLPSLYARSATGVDGQGGCDPGDPGDPGVSYVQTSHYYRTNVLEMRHLRDTYNPSLMILPFVWREYKRSAGCSNDVNDFVSKQQFYLPKFYGADGVMIWDNISRSDASNGNSAAGRLEALVSGNGLWKSIIETETSGP